MTLVLGIDSGLDGAFAWYYGGRVVHTVFTRDFVRNGQLDLSDLPSRDPKAWYGLPSQTRAVAYLETPIRMRGKGESGVETMFRNDGRIEERLRVLGYEVRRVLPKVWQGNLLDLDNFKVPVTRKCKPRLADGWRLTPVKGVAMWRLRSVHGTDVSWSCSAGRNDAILGAERIAPASVTRTKTITSHDTKAASLAYVRANFPDVNLIPPRAKKEHDGLADAVCIAVWGSTQVKET